MLPRLLVDMGLSTAREKLLRRFSEPIRVEVAEVYSEDELIDALSGYRGLLRWATRFRT